jgi:hypothetical protein
LCCEHLALELNVAVRHIVRGSEFMDLYDGEKRKARRALR